MQTLHDNVILFILLPDEKKTVNKKHANFSLYN
jgi:hypothetical protein